jgi:CyaY protein
MAADRSAWHFDYLPAEKRWVASKTGDELWAALAAAIGKKLGRKVVLAAVN